MPESIRRRLRHQPQRTLASRLARPVWFFTGILLGYARRRDAPLMEQYAERVRDISPHPRGLSTRSMLRMGEDLRMDAHFSAAAQQQASPGTWFDVVARKWRLDESGLRDAERAALGLLDG